VARSYARASRSRWYERGPHDGHMRIRVLASAAEASARDRTTHPILCMSGARGQRKALWRLSIWGVRSRVRMSTLQRGTRIKISGVRSIRTGCWASRRVCPYRGLVCPCQGLLVGPCDAMRGLIEAGIGFASRSFLFALCFLRLDFGFGVWPSRLRCAHILSLSPHSLLPSHSHQY
jgi:hypothetical protein